MVSAPARYNWGTDKAETLLPLLWTLQIADFDMQSTQHDCTWQLQMSKNEMLHRPDIHCCHRFPKLFLRSDSMSSTSFSASFFFRSASCSKACTLCLTTSASSWGLAAGLELLRHTNQSPCFCNKTSNQATQTCCRWPPTQSILKNICWHHSISNPGWQKTLWIQHSLHCLSCKNSIILPVRARWLLALGTCTSWRGCVAWACAAAWCFAFLCGQAKPFFQGPNSKQASII